MVRATINIKAGAVCRTRTTMRNVRDSTMGLLLPEVLIVVVLCWVLAVKVVTERPDLTPSVVCSARPRLAWAHERWLTSCAAHQATSEKSRAVKPMRVSSLAN